MVKDGMMKKQLRTIEVKVIWVVACLIWAWLLGFYFGTINQRTRDLALIRHAAKITDSQELEIVASFVEGNVITKEKREESNETP
jgi:hypothetical protein